MSDTILSKNPPNAAKLISSLRHSGYDNYTAIEDLIDNSIDADAKMIRVIAENKNGVPRIMIFDNGTGMDAEVLDEALKLGSDTSKNNKHLGKFWMGLCTASISIGKKLEVVTRDVNGRTLYSKQDLETVEEMNEFVKTLRDANWAEKLAFDSFAGPNGTGTLISLTELDRLSDSNLTQFGKTLQKSVARKFRHFLQKGIAIEINGHRVLADDPLMLDHPDTSIFSDEDYEIPESIVGNKKSSVHVKIAILPEMPEALMRELKIGIRNQGFYLMRNGREIASAQSLWVFEKHNDLNRMRIELTFDSDLDDVFGVVFNKASNHEGGNTIKKAIIEFLKENLGWQVATIRTRMKALQWMNESLETKSAHDDSAKVIKTQGATLVTPKEKPLPAGVEASKNDAPVRFETRSMWREGVLYECEQEGKTIIIRWNANHPFYEKMIRWRSNDKDLVSSLDFLIYSLACAELRISNDDNAEIMANIRTIMSMNLRVLLA